MKLTYENDLIDPQYHMIEHLIVMSVIIHDMKAVGNNFSDDKSILVTT